MFYHQEKSIKLPFSKERIIVLGSKFTQFRSVMYKDQQDHPNVFVSLLKVYNKSYRVLKI